MPAPQTSKLTPKYSWEADSGRYRNIATGRFVPQEQVTRAVEKQAKRARDNMQTLSKQLQANEIGLNDWRKGMLKEIKTAHVASSVAANGGWAQMDQKKWGSVGQELKTQYEYLNRLSSQIQYGTQPTDGRFLQRVNLYANASESTYRNTVRAQKVEAGYTEGRRVLHGKDNCESGSGRIGCVEVAARDWTPIADMVPIGDCTCLDNCQCIEEYR